MMVGMYEVKLYGPQNFILDQWTCDERDVHFEVEVQRGQRFSWSDLQDVLMALSETVGEYEIAADVRFDILGLGDRRDAIVAVGRIVDRSTGGTLNVI